VVYCYDLEEQSHGSTEKNIDLVCFLGGGKPWKKKKLGLYRLWKKLLEWLWAALDRVSASRFKCVGLGLKPKRGNRAGTKAMGKNFSAGPGSLIDAAPGSLGFSVGSKPGSVPPQPETSLVAFLSVSGDYAIQQLGSRSPPPKSLEALSLAPVLVSNVVGSFSLGASSSAVACSVFQSFDVLPLQVSSFSQSCITSSQSFSGAAELGKRLCSSSPVL